MATIDQEREQFQSLQQLLGTLAGIQPESLVRNDDLGKDLNFEAGLPVFRRTLGLFSDLKECNLDNIPYESLVQLSQQAEQVANIIGAIKNFSLQQNPQNPVSARDTLIQQLRDRWQQDYAVVTPFISYSIRKGTDFDALEREARGTLALQNAVVSVVWTATGVE